MKVKFLIILGVFLSFVSCGGGGNENRSSSDLINIDMVLNKTYTISEGQSIVKKSEDARVLLNNDIKTGETKAILKSGKCVITSSKK